MNSYGVTSETLNKYQELVAGQMGQGGQNILHPLAKSYTTGLGLVGYNLEAPAKQIVPFLSPLRNKIPRTISPTGVATHWKRITAVSPAGKLTAVEGARGSAVNTTLEDKQANYKIFGLQDVVTLEAIAAGRNFQDAKATATTNLLLRAMTEEEKMILFGNTTTALGVISKPTATATSSPVGTIASATYTVKVAALTGIGANRVILDTQVANLVLGVGATDNTGTPIVGSFDGVTAASSGQTVAIAATKSVNLSVTPVTGALAYAWFVGLSAGVARLQMVSSGSAINLTSLVTGGTLASAVTVDGTADANAFDGIVPQIIAGGGYFKDMGNTKMTKSNSGVLEIDNICASLYAQWKLGPTKIWCGYQVFSDITNAIVSTGGSPTMFVMNEANTKANIVGGYRVATYINKYYNGQQIELEVHPWMPPNMMVALTETIPYPNANIPAAFEIDNGFDYMQLEYAVTKPQYEFEIRWYGALKCYFPAACAVVTNVKPGLN